ncbi:peptidoglycan DD-metalloendopeptidase family protein [Noviherbaspirillum sp. CPCC 100848]|uniref:Peptidoglycan DD-metalloendopeptidase family protein n=1 Tax=Noviherbaspirillum album TaxID=3080276 RepID=A0ABU6JDW5_9BURK|nr:peptidoglycan DD-metalloendopeptidase family protein [Noviherbaspirillum sp. CPCC 100848]MEC4721437.1 peptidoglycan DD-metalloendopeptidase family protein [Noviherbaspirillum sp. CPCC 100848]
MRTKQSLFIAALSIWLAACTTPHGTAPVVDRPVGPRVGEAPKPAAPPPAQQQAAPATRADNRGFYTVRRGDTLIQIALDFGQNYRDIVAWNNLANPNDIKVDQVLRVLPPDGAPQTGSVASAPGTEVRPLTPPQSAAGAVPNKSGPRGDKRPYSDGILAELQKPDSAVAAPAAPAAGTPPRAEAPKAVDKTPEPGPSGDDENIAWIWPAEGRVISHFSEGKRGIDIAGKMGQPVVAAGSGKVLYAGSGIRGYGNLVIVKHSNNLLSAYAHNKTIFVKEDQNVTKGQKIAEMGNSDTDEVKLHFEIRQQGKPVDPSKFLPSR